MDPRQVNPTRFHRIGGRVYAVQDSCLHRSVPFSARPECYTNRRRRPVTEQARQDAECCERPTRS